ncbi:MAG: hypothetical protein AAGJ51_00940 [Pseudomonadota bacterium]
MTSNQLGWSQSKLIGGVTELSVLAPIKNGRVPGERRTYEERLRFVISTIQSRVEKGLPNHLRLIPTIHFGQLLIIRPEHYLRFTNSECVEYLELNVPKPLEDYKDCEVSSKLAPADAAAKTKPQKKESDCGVGAKVGPIMEREKNDFHSWLLTTVYFDGDLKVYIRDIAEFIRTDFDRVYANCLEYPSADNFEKFWLWVRKYQISPDLFHNACNDLSVARIKQLEDFRRLFNHFVAKVRSPNGYTVESIHELFDEFLRENQQYASGFPTAGGVYETKSR